MKKVLLFTFFILFFTFSKTIAQYCPCFNNPSLEGIPTIIANVDPHVAPQWIECQSPNNTVGPNNYIFNPPTDGSTWQGIFGYSYNNPNTPNSSIGQKLCSSLIGGKQYKFNVDLTAASTTNLPYNIDDGILKIWGGNSSCSQMQLLWTSPVIKADDIWGRYCVTLNPSSDMDYIRFVAESAPGQVYFSCILIDNIRCSSIKPNASPDQIISCGNCVNISASANGGQAPYTYSWTPNIGSGPGPFNVCPVITTTYVVQVSDGISCGVSTDTIIVKVVPSQNITVTSSTICSNKNATLIANGASTYTWSTGATPINGSTITVSPSTTTTYTVMGSNGNCISTAISTVNVLPVVAVNIPSTSICYGSTATLTASGAATYTWLPMNTTGASTNVTPTVTTTYSVIGTIGACTGSTTVNVLVGLTIPSVSVTTATVCAGTPVLLTASGANSYSWSTGATTETAVVTPITNPTTYTVIGSVNGCTNTAVSSLSVLINPTITVKQDTTIILGTSTPLSLVSSGTSYTWSPSLGLSCTTCTNPIAKPIVSTQYCVNTVLGSCPTSSCIMVNVELACYSNPEYTTPNAFTPNGDDTNDEFCLQGWSECTLSFYISIFDRWGEKVFSSEDPGFCWDGTYMGMPLNTGVFIYHIKAEVLKGGTITRKGNVTLMR